MLHYPDVLRKAQAEVDRVVGRHRLPTLEDEAELHYIRALISEVHRWRPLVPLVQPHLASQDDEFEGYKIPKGAMVWANLQAMSRNEAVYPQHQHFKPERFLAQDGTFTRKDEIAIFGYGKRRCPGDQLGGKIVFIDVATMIWAMDMQVREGDELPTSDVEQWHTYIGLL